MVFDLKSADFQPELRKRPARRIVERFKPRLDEFSPEEWEILNTVLEECRASGIEWVSGESRQASYCRDRLKNQPPKEQKKPRLKLKSTTGASVLRGDVKTGLWRDRSGAAAVEFALVMPVFILMICAVLVYGGWFSMAQSVQSLATESARASVGGLTSQERHDLAAAYFESKKASAGMDAAGLEVSSTDDSTRVVLRFDTSNTPLMALSQIVPSPPRIIERSATVHVGET